MAKANSRTDARVQLALKVDAGLEVAAAKALAGSGMGLEEMVNLFLHRIVDEKGFAPQHVLNRSAHAALIDERPFSEALAKTGTERQAAKPREHWLARPPASPGKVRSEPSGVGHMLGPETS